jgi:hydrogenase maturation protein HypF
VLGIILDGLGFGEDGTIWGGEFLVGDYVDYQRLAYLKPVPMPGGTQAILQPWRNTWAHLQALGWDKVQHYCQELELIQFLQAQPLATLASMLANNMNSPMTSSCGRLFDAVAAALNCSREQISYEGQAAIELEAITPPILLDYVAGYPFALEETKGQWIINPQNMWCALLHDLKTGYDRGTIAAQFLKGLVQVITELALKICQSREDIKAIVLSGGVFQNVLLWNSVKTSLEQAGKQVLVHKKFPTNDGGLALGQAVIGATQLIR